MKKLKCLFLLYLFVATMSYTSAHGQSAPEFAGADFPASLKPFLTTEQIDSCRLAKKRFNELTSAKELHEFYQKFLPRIHDIITQGISKSNPEVDASGNSSPDEIWAILSEYLPMIKVECMCSECFSLPINNIRILLDKAKQTSGLEDDLYFDFLKVMYAQSPTDIIIYEDGGNVNNYYTMDGCDFCSYSNLGTGSIYKILKASDKALQAGGLFKEFITDYRSRAFPVKQAHYGESKVKVLKEIEEIIAGCNLSADELKKIKRTKSEISLGKGIQFNCKGGRCKYDY